MDIDALNAEHGIEGTLRLREDRGGLPMIEIENGLASAAISLHGGQVLSYRPAAARCDLLYECTRAWCEPGRDIKAGIPICWPWFGRDPEGRQIHGFVGDRPWTLLWTASLPNGATRVRLGISDDAQTRAIWPHPFDLSVEATVGATLSVELIARNTGDRAYRVTQGLHSYFRVGDVRLTRLLGLEGCRYIDKAVGGNDAIRVQEGPVVVDREVNRIYEQVQPDLVLEDPTLGRRIRIGSCHSSTCVVWNPWIETAREMEDLGDLDYLDFLCVETVNAASEVVEIPGGGEARLAAELAVEPL